MVAISKNLSFIRNLVTVMLHNLLSFKLSQYFIRSTAAAAATVAAVLKVRAFSRVYAYAGFHDGCTFAIRWRRSRVADIRCQCSWWSRINWTMVHRHDRLCCCLCRCEWCEDCSPCLACCHNIVGATPVAHTGVVVEIFKIQRALLLQLQLQSRGQFPVVVDRVCRTPTVAVACDGSGGSVDIGGGVIDNLQQISEQVALKIWGVARLAACFEQVGIGGKDVPQFRVEEDLAAGFQVGYLRTVAYVVHDAFPIFTFNIIRLTDRHVERRPRWTVLTGAKLGHHIAHQVSNLTKQIIASTFKMAMN
ncbi:hypothetical protein T4A_11988 [Trichinella pseudospiralis]|uniref:Uncharacterized protein n=1 Tax=Trichinella pseudospiralis TaxID=6337 RepID=A0A0V1E2W2_TRIPS|nr:hypothetical protein T4A_11988 [Trichinella pseudospiralis]